MNGSRFLSGALTGVLFATVPPLAILSVVWWGWGSVAMYLFSALALIGCGFAVTGMRLDFASGRRIATVIALTGLGITSAILGSTGAGIGIAYEPRVVLLVAAWALWAAAAVTALTSKGADDE